MKKIYLFVVALLFTVCSVFASDLPNPKITPGATNPNVTTKTLKTTICQVDAKGKPVAWTGTVRPPSSYTNKLKITQIKQYGFVDTDPTHYEEDHLINLSLGGHPTDPKNLWPQQETGTWTAVQKDQLEKKMQSLVCSGKVSLSVAQKAVAKDWIAAYKKYVMPPVVIATK